MARGKFNKPDEHPCPHVDVPMSLLGDIMFMGPRGYETLGQFVHAWCAAVWKKDPTFHGFYWIRDSEERSNAEGLALRLKFLVERRGVIYLTGPNKDPKWLVGLPKRWTTYAIEAIGQDRVKIGKATDVVKRLETLQIGCPTELLITHTHVGDIEADIHKVIRSKWIGGEWFSLDPEVRAVISTRMKAWVP